MCVSLLSVFQPRAILYKDGGIIVPGKTVWTIVGIASIWLGVLFVSLFAPDFVSGSEQEHIPIAALVTWISGAAATRSVLNMMTRRQGTEQNGVNSWAGMAISIAIIWLAVTLISIFVPEVVTGSDPTRIPLAAILAPIGGAIVTGTVGQFAERIYLPEGKSSAPACPSCGKENPPEARFCLACGAELRRPADVRFCDQCGAKALPQAKYCSSCGSKLP